MPPRTLSRRAFLGEAACAAVTATPLISTLMNLSMTNAMAANTLPVNSVTDYKALVCILLAGGNDSFNMLVPRGTTNTMNMQVSARTSRWPRTVCMP